MRVGLPVCKIRGYFTKVLNEVDLVSYFLLLILAIIVFYPLFSVGFTTMDDADIAMNYGRNSGLIETSKLHAISQGRFSFFWSYPLLRLPYIFDSNLWCFATKFVSFFLLLSAIYYAINRLFKSSWVALVALLFFLAFIQNGWDHNALTSYPVAFNMYAILFLFSLGLFSKAIDQKSLALAVLSGVLYFFSIGVELFVLLSPLYVAVLLSRAASGETFVSKLVANRKYILAIAIPLAAYLAFYVMWRTMHPSIYDGNSFNGFNLLSACKVVFTYSFNAFPLRSIHFMLSPAQQLQFGNTAGIRDILFGLSSIHFIKPAVVGFLFIRMMTTESLTVPQNRTLIIGATLAFISIFIPNLLLGFIPKHQAWVESGSYSYLYTYYSFISAVFFVALVTTYLNVKSRLWQPRFRLALILMGVVVVTALTFFVEVRNQYIAFDQKLSHRKWQLIDYVIKSPTFRSIPEGATVVAPTLSAHHRGITVASADYWSKYVKYKTGKKVQFVDDKCKIGAPCFSLIFRQEAHADNQFIVLAKIKNYELLTASNLTIYSMPIQESSVLIGSFISSKISPEIEINGMSVGNVGDGLFASNLSFFSGDASINAAMVTGNVDMFPDQLTISHYSDVPRLQPFSINLGEGFYGWESSPDQAKWAWSKGTSTLNVSNYNSNVLKLKAKFEVTSLEDIELNISGGSALSFKIVSGIYQPIEFEFVAQPGLTNINLVSNRLPINPSSSDSRLLSFSIRNLRIENK